MEENIAQEPAQAKREHDVGESLLLLLRNEDVQNVNEQDWHHSNEQGRENPLADGGQLLQR